MSGKVLFPLVLLVACGTSFTDPAAQAPTRPPQAVKDLSVAHFAAGCFWCTEEIFEHVNGVAEVINGYAGGTVENPTYDQVVTGTTGHAEAIEVYYDPQVVDFATLVAVFFASQDPTTPSRQGPDVGPQYRSIAFYGSPEEEQLIRREIRLLERSGKYDRPIVTEVQPFVKFWPAEEEHQNYTWKHPNTPYVRHVSKPRLERFKAAMPEVIKKNAP